jgi:hypothetical protein
MGCFYYFADEQAIEHTRLCIDIHLTRPCLRLSQFAIVPTVEPHRSLLLALGVDYYFINSTNLVQ